MASVGRVTVSLRRSTRSGSLISPRVRAPSRTTTRATLSLSELAGPDGCIRSSQPAGSQGAVHMGPTVTGVTATDLERADLEAMGVDPAKLLVVARPIAE